MVCIESKSGGYSGLMTVAKAKSRAQTFTISDLVDYAREGALRIPEFQRSFRWGQKDIFDLFDSIRRGYPVGNALLWRREAPAGNVRFGELGIVAPERHDALWVVDGQQRITSLVNAVAEEIDANSQFAVVYLPKHERFTSLRNARGQVAVPVPTLFSIPRLFMWFQENPDGQQYAEHLQTVTTALRDFALPTTVLERADEDELRRIFDRINNAGKRLKKSEVFNAINGASGSGAEIVNVTTIADSLASSTTFGRMPDDMVYSALLVRRHPDLTRSPNDEFTPDRRKLSDFPDEDEATSFRRTEDSLHATVKFLQDRVGVPHMTFLPQQFLLLILNRYFSLFPDPDRRTRRLLVRWFWRAAANAVLLSLSSSTSVRKLTKLIVKGDEHGSIQRLLDAVKVENTFTTPDLEVFRTNQGASRIALCTMWARHPRSLETRKRLEFNDLAASVEEIGSLNDVVRRVVSSNDCDERHRISTGNRVILGFEDPDIADWMAMVYDSIRDREIDEVLASHFFTPDDVRLFGSDPQTVIERRTQRIVDEVHRFLDVQTGRDPDASAPAAPSPDDEL